MMISIFPLKGKGPEISEIIYLTHGKVFIANCSYLNSLPPVRAPESFGYVPARFPKDDPISRLSIFLSTFPVFLDTVRKRIKAL